MSQSLSQLPSIPHHLIMLESTVLFLLPWVERRRAGGFSLSTSHQQGSLCLSLFVAPSSWTSNGMKVLHLTRETAGSGFPEATLWGEESRTLRLSCSILLAGPHSQLAYPSTQSPQCVVSSQLLQPAAERRAHLWSGRSQGESKRNNLISPKGCYM